MGVGAGVADYTGMDPLIVRLALVLAVLGTGPVAVVLYVAAGLLASDRCWGRAIAILCSRNNSSVPNRRKQARFGCVRQRLTVAGKRSVNRPVA
jgi:phage shock protein C